MDKGEQEAVAQQPAEPSEGEISGDELVPTPPDSPLPSTGAFAPILSGGPDLDDEFYAIPSSPGEFYCTVLYHCYDIAKCHNYF